MRVLSSYTLTKIYLSTQQSYLRLILLFSSDTDLTPRSDTNYDQHNLNTLPFLNNSLSNNETRIILRLLFVESLSIVTEVNEECGDCLIVFHKIYS